MKPSEFIKENEEYSREEYDDEAGMVKTNLITTIRMAIELAKNIDDNEDLPEWCQEKIAVAKGMIVAVGDYIISQHEQGIEPHISEDASAGGTSSGSVATSMGDSNGWGKSIFYKEAERKTKKKSKK